MLYALSFVSLAGTVYSAAFVLGECRHRAVTGRWRYGYVTHTRWVTS